MGKFVFYSAGLVAIYLLVANATNAGKLIASAGQAGSGYVKTLQGR